MTNHEKRLSETKETGSFRLGQPSSCDFFPKLNVQVSLDMHQPVSGLEVGSKTPKWSLVDVTSLHIGEAIIIIIIIISSRRDPFW